MTRASRRYFWLAWGAVIWWSVTIVAAGAIAFAVANIADPHWRKIAAGLVALAVAAVIAFFYYRGRRLRSRWDD